MNRIYFYFLRYRLSNAAANQTVATIETTPNSLPTATTTTTAKTIATVSSTPNLHSSTTTFHLDSSDDVDAISSNGFFDICCNSNVPSAVTVFNLEGVGDINRGTRRGPEGMGSHKTSCISLEKFNSSQSDHSETNIAPNIP